MATDCLHVHPVGDIIEHDTSDAEGNCPCGPEARPVTREDGSVGWLLVHHSLDNREAQETP